MYKIKVLNTETGKTWWEYGFKNFLFKRIHFFFNETNPYDNYQTYEVLAILKLNFSLKVFKKCLTNYAEYI